MQVMGMGSGIDIQSLINQLVEIEKAPINTLNTKKTKYNSQLSIWSDVKTKLTSMLDKVESLQSTEIFRSTKAASSAGEVATASTQAGAAAGTYNLHVTSLATSTSIQSTARMGQQVNPDVALKDSGLGIAVTAGSFSVNGTSFTIDPETETLNGVLNKIQSAGLGITASFDQGTGKVSFSYIGADTGTVQLGSGADTSNFFKAIGVDGKIGETITSTTSLGSIDANIEMDTARFNVPIEASGEFEINGIKIQYDAATESLNDIIEKINSSDAQVSAKYDPLTDSLAMTAKYTGSKTIQMADLSGNFLATVGLDGANQTLGTNAEFSIDEVFGGQSLTSSSNDISDIVPGLTFNLKTEGDTTVAVSKDIQESVNAVKAFVSQYNNVMSVISSKTAKDGTMQGDSTMQRLQYNLRRLTTDQVLNGSEEVTLASQIGITIDKTGVMSVDETKLKEALTDRPTAVSNLFNATDGIATRLADEIDIWVKSTSGIIPTKEDAINKRIEDITKDIEKFNERVETKRQLLVKQFTAMDKLIATLNSQSSWLSSQFSLMSSSE